MWFLHHASQNAVTRKIFIQRRLSLTKPKKGQCRSLQVYLVKAPRICTVPNVINAIKMIFLKKKKGDFKEQCFFFPLSSFSLYCNDLPNALDTAVRLCSYSLTLAVLNGSARMKYSTKEDRAFIFKTLNTSGNMVSTYKEVNLTDYGRYVNKSQCRVKIVNADKCSTVAVVYF